MYSSASEWEQSVGSSNRDDITCSSINCTKGTPPLQQYTCGSHRVQLRMTTRPQKWTVVKPSHPDHYQQTMQEPRAPSGPSQAYQ